MEMSEQHNVIQMLGYLTAPPSQKPTSIPAAVESALTEHLRVHANDGMSLFVFVVTCGTDPKPYLYRLSVQNREMAFQIAMSLHASRGLPPAKDWTLIFEYPEPRDRYLLL